MSGPQVILVMTLEVVYDLVCLYPQRLFHSSFSRLNQNPAFRSLFLKEHIPTQSPTLCLTYICCLCGLFLLRAISGLLITKRSSSIVNCVENGFASTTTSGPISFYAVMN